MRIMIPYMNCTMRAIAILAVCSVAQVCASFDAAYAVELADVRALMERDLAALDRLIQKAPRNLPPQQFDSGNTIVFANPTRGDLSTRRNALQDQLDAFEKFCKLTPEQQANKMRNTGAAAAKQFCSALPAGSVKKLSEKDLRSRGQKLAGPYMSDAMMDAFMQGFFDHVAIVTANP